MSFLSVQEVLIAELKLLAQCDGMKKKFDKYIRDGDVERVPSTFVKFVVQCQ